MRKGNLRFWIVGLVALATIINYIDRGALAVLWPEISEELGLTKTEYAVIINVFTFAYAFGQTLFGKIFDWVGVRLGFVLSIVAWSAATMLHAAANGLLSFAVFRGLLGLSEAGNWPGATKANAEWFPINERALAQGIFNSGAAIGGIISAPLVGVMFVFLESWQATFIAIGMLGFLWLIPWLIVYKSGPEAHPWIGEAERQFILTGQRNEHTNEVADYAPDTGEILSRKESWGVILASFFIDPIWWLFVGWLPLYLFETYGFGVEEIAAYAWVPYVGAMFGAWFGGLLAQNRIGAGWTVDKTRKSVIALGGLERRSLDAMDFDFFEHVMRLNMTSTFLATKAAVPHMPDKGAIVNFASQAGRDGGGPGAAAYACSKGAVITFTRSMAKELEPRGIRVNSLCPGMIATSFHDTFTKDEVRTSVAGATPLRRQGDARETADAAVFLASEEASFITGANLDINGGLLFS